MSWYLFWAPQGVYVLEKYDGLSESVAFAQIWGILLTKMNHKPHENELWLFSNTKIMITKS